MTRTTLQDGLLQGHELLLMLRDHFVPVKTEVGADFLKICRKTKWLASSPQLAEPLVSS